MTNSHVSSPSGRPLVPPDLFRLANEHLSLAIFDDKELMAMVALCLCHEYISIPIHMISP